MKKESSVSKKSDLTDVKTLRKQARQHIQTVIKLLNDALATELVCVLRYRRHYFMANGIESKSIADEFLMHANEEQGHADQLALREFIKISRLVTLIVLFVIL
jgi:bacterioferritin